jgi:radical SAM protein with 4Fe4S-binding SPASM domain
MEIQEKYYLLRRGSVACRYGAFKLTREYFRADQVIPPPVERTISLEIPPPKLKVMQAVITSSCNLKCTYCSFAANAPAGMSARMSDAEIKALCGRFNDEIGAKGLLLITGGEPELNHRAIDYLVQTISGKIIIFTNGTLTSRQRLTFYRDQDVGVLFSLDGDLFAHDTARRTRGGSYARVAEALQEAHELGLDFGISAVVGDHNIEKLPELVAYIHQTFHPASLGLNLPHHHGTVWERIEEYTQALIEIFEWAKGTGLFIDQINRRLEPLLRGKFRFRDCAAQGEKVVVFPGGVETHCVNEATIKGYRLDWGYRIPLLNSDCRECFAIGVCGGGCIFDGETSYGPGRFDQRNCHFTRELLTHLLWDLWDELGDMSNDPKKLEQKYGPLLNRGKGTKFSVGHETA